MSIILYIAATLDGFIATGDGSVAWLDDFQDVDYGYQAFLESVGTLIMGRHTYDQVLAFGEWPYDAKTTVVLTRQGAPETPQPEGVSFYSGDVRKLLEQLEIGQGGDIWLVGGARTNAQFFKYDLVDEIYLAIMPTTLGQGIPLTTPIDERRRFELVEAKPFENGVVMLHYRKQDADSASSSVEDI